MKEINCSKKTFKQALSETRPFYDRTTYKMVYRRGTAEEHAKLSFPKHGLFPATLFHGPNHGQALDPTTWLMVLRANMRGKLALRKLLTPSYEDAVTPSGHAYRKRKDPEPQELVAAIDEQDRILDGMIKACPGFFAGMLVPEEEPGLTKEQRRRNALRDQNPDDGVVFRD